MPGVPKLFTDLKTFINPYFFFGDELHMLGHGMGHMVYKLLDPRTDDWFQAADVDHYPFQVSLPFRQKEFMKKLGDWIVVSKPTCPAAFNYSFDKRTGYYRAVDWQDFLLYVVPTIVVPNLRYRRAKVAVMNLVNAVSISLQKSITSTDLDVMDRYTINKAYILEFERLTKK